MTARRGAWPAALMRQAVQHYLDGASIRDTAVAIGKSYGHTRDLLQASGVELRPQGDRSKSTRLERAAPPEPPVLPPEQRAILGLIAQGRGTPKELTSRLNYSISTVVLHKRRLLAALGAIDAAHAVARAYDLGILPVDEGKVNG